MSIERRVQLVEKLFHQLEQDTAQFQKDTNLSCLAGCGKCCSHPDVDASPLEFLPWAFHLFLNGEAESTLEQISESPKLTCHIFKPIGLENAGRCSDYKYRGLICRLFAFAANTDKYGTLRLATCKIIKEDQPEQYNSAVVAISKGLKVPVFTEYYMQLSNIDFQLGNKILPINKALKMALEEVLMYYAYRPIPLIDKKIV